MDKENPHWLEQVRIQPGIEPSIEDERDAITYLRASLRVVTDKLESLHLDGPEKKGRTKDDRDAYQGWLDEMYGSIAHARAVLKATEEYADSTSCRA